MMYESTVKLRIKADAGIESAIQEIESRKETRVILPLRGINGESVCMSLTEKILSGVATVKTIYQQVSNEKKERDTILIDAYHSATIEGARTTVDQVKKVFLQPTSKDDKMVVNTVKACNFAYQTPIDDKNIRDLWDIIVDGVCENESKAGTCYRDGMVYIGNETKIIHVPAAVGQIKELMGQLFNFLREFPLEHMIKAFVSHFYFVYVHPFCDGNGRMARVMTSSYLYHHGYEKIQYLPLSRTINENLSGYYGSLVDSEWKYEENGSSYLDITPFISYMIDSFEKCIMTSILEEKELNPEQKLLLTKMKKQGNGAEISVKNAMKILKKSEEETVEILKSLSNTGHLKMISRDGKDIFIL